MAKKRKAERKSRIWYVSLDKRCKPSCATYTVALEVVLSFTKSKFSRGGCGCALVSGHMMMSLAEFHAYFANAPELVPGGPPVRVRLRMEKV